MPAYTWGLAIPPTGSAKGPVTAGGMYASLAKAAGRQLIFRVDPDTTHEASFTIGGTVPEASDMQELINDVVVRRDGRWLFRGRILSSQDQLDGSGHKVAVKAASYRELLKYRALLNLSTLSYTAVDQSDVAWALIDYAQQQPGGWLGITRGTGVNTGVQRTVTYAKTDYVGDKISELAKMDSGFDWDLTLQSLSSWTFDVWAPTRGRTTSVFLEHGSSLVASVQRQVDGTSYGNKVYLTGDPSAALTPAVATASDIATRPEGRFELVIGTTIKTQSALNSRAAFALQDAEVIQPAYTVVLAKNAWRGPDHIWIGDLVTLRIRSGRLDVNAAYRVMQLQVDLGDDGDETVTLTMNALPLPLHKKIPLIMRRLRDVELR